MEPVESLVQLSGIRRMSAYLRNVQRRQSGGGRSRISYTGDSQRTVGIVRGSGSPGMIDCVDDGVPST